MAPTLRGPTLELQATPPLLSELVTIPNGHLLIEIIGEPRPRLRELEATSEHRNYRAFILELSAKATVSRPRRRWSAPDLVILLKMPKLEPRRNEREPT